MKKNKAIKKLSFKNFLLEESDDNTENLEELISKIKRECSEFINNPKIKQNYLDHYHFLLRGINDTELPPINDNALSVSRIFSGKIRKDRQPRDSSSHWHNFLDDVFKEKLGVKLRSETLFTCFDSNIAADYGALIIVIPKNGSRFFVSNKIEDSFSDFVNTNRLSLKMINYFSKYQNKELFDGLSDYGIINQKLVDKVLSFLPANNEALLTYAREVITSAYIKIIANYIRNSDHFDPLFTAAIRTIFDSISTESKIFFQNLKAEYSEAERDGSVGAITQVSLDLAEQGIFSEKECKQVFEKFGNIIKDGYEVFLNFEEKDINDIFVNTNEYYKKEIMIANDSYYGIRLKETEIQHIERYGVLTILEEIFK